MGYIGSVRFFKNMILLGVITGIAIPTGLSIHYKNEVATAREETATAQAGILEMQGELQQLQSQKLATMAMEAEPEAEPEVAVGEAPAYQALYPDFYAPEPLTADERAEKVIYLTFDDGPSERTDEVLEILARQDVKATFFVVGQSSQENKQRMRDIVEQGHTLAIHSYSHDYKKIYSSVEAFLEDMYAMFTQIREETGTTPTVFRFPGGSINSHNYGIYQEIVAEMLRRGFVPHDWNLSSGDAVSTPPPAAQIVRNVVGGAAGVDRGVVLMHDSTVRTTTVAALEEMIVQLREQGFTFDRLDSQVKPVLFSYRN